MAKKIRFTLIAKLLLIVLAIVVFSNLVVGLNSEKTSTKAITGIAYQYLEIVTQDAAHQIEGVNTREFALIRGLAQMDGFRSEEYSLQTKQAQLNGILRTLGEKYQNLAFYDKNGNAIRDNGEIWIFQIVNTLKQS